MPQFKPLPTKHTLSFDVPKLLGALERDGVFYTNTDFRNLLVVRSYISRHKPPYRLKQESIDGGFKLSLVHDH